MAKRRTSKRKRVYRQVGKSNIAIDRLLSAKKPGYRVSSSGVLYFENRANRSDKSRKRRL